jgi:predicted small lipoprotein YifL
MRRLPVILTAAALIGIFAVSGCGKKEAIEMPASPKTEVGQAVTRTDEQAEAPTPSTEPITEERTYYDFETADLSGWEVPQWALGKTDYVAKEAVYSEETSSKGKGSMRVAADFPGGQWTAALVEIQQYLDLSRYRVIRADVYLPADAPIGLTAKLIITVGENWRFVEMSRSFPLIPGEWTEITASIEPGSYDWKRVVPDESFAEDIRKIAVRIESNRKPKYTGDLFIDNVRVGR